MDADERPSHHITRRDVLAGMGGGLVALSVSAIDGGLASAQVQGRRAARLLSEAEVAALEALGEVLLPGSRAAGITRYVDAQLARKQPLLFVRYIDSVEDPVAFYRGGLAALDEVSRSRHGKAFAACEPAQQVKLVREMSRGDPQGWHGPPAPLFYFALRNDAVDVQYGTPDGFRRLQVPYSAHLEPPRKW